MPPTVAQPVTLPAVSAKLVLKKKRRNASSASAANGLVALLSRLKNWMSVSGDAFTELQRRQTSTGGGLEHIRERLTKELCVLCSGVAYRYWLSLNGERGISELYYPGDFINYDMLIYGESNCLLAAKGAKFATLGREAVGIIRETPALDAVVRQAEVAKSYFLTDRFCASLRSRAEERVLRALLEMKAHEELTHRRASEAVLMQFTQRELGDMTGLTPVYVSKVMSRLQQQGHIIRHGRYIQFHNRAHSERSCGFMNYYARLLSSGAESHAA